MIYLAAWCDAEMTNIVGVFFTFKEAEEAAIKAARATRSTWQHDGRIYYEAWTAWVYELEEGEYYEDSIIPGEEVWNDEEEDDNGELPDEEE